MLYKQEGRNVFTSYPRAEDEPAATAVDTQSIKRELEKLFVYLTSRDLFTARNSQERQI